MQLSRFTSADAPSRSNGRPLRWPTRGGGLTVVLIALLAGRVHAVAGPATTEVFARDDGGSQGEQEPCAAYVTKEPLPGFAGVQTHFGPTSNGFDFGSGHMMTNMSVPEPVPIALSCSDMDTLYKYCLSDCIREGVGGYWTAEWTTLDMGSGGARGSFLDANGNSVDMIADSQQVVYLPPRDLQCGEVRSVGIRGRIWDIGPDTALRDTPVDVYYQVDVWRQSAPSPSYYWVLITPFLPAPSDLSPPPCATLPASCCTYNGGTTQMGSGISVGVASQPAGMLVGDVRTVVLFAQDWDSVVFECGVAPDCPSMLGSEAFSDGLTYTWTVVNGPATIHSQGRSALIQAGSTPGKVDLQVVVDDCTGLCFDDPPVTVNISFYVHRLDFIDSANVVQPRLGPTTNLNEGLRVSQVVTNLAGSMNGCGGAAATFAGPVPAQPDPRTYRTEGDRGGAPAQTQFQVRIRTSHAWPGADYEGGAEYDHTFNTLEQGGTFRSDLHFRLVSNKAPATGAAPGGVYDDMVCGDQSILALPGDWVTATLVANGVAVGSIELPVERPWGEAGLPPAGPQSILSGRIHWLTNVGTAGGGQGDFYARRMTEDFAQAGIRGELAAATAGIGPFENALLMLTNAAIGPGPGYVTINMSNEHGNWAPVSLYVGAFDTYATVADKIVAAINLHPGFVAEAYYYPTAFLPNQPYAILINRRSNVTIWGWNVGTTGLSLALPALNYTDAVLTRTEQVVLGLNLKPDLGATQSAIDTIVTTATSIDFAIGPGKSWTTVNGTVPEADFPGLSHTVFLVDLAGNGSDAQWAQVASHEYGHILMDDGNALHPPPAGNAHRLMVGGAAFPPSGDAPERPENVRRLNTAECTDSRSDGAQFLTMAGVPIPERK